MIIARYLWRRLDSPGHDACQFEKTATGYRMAGMAAFMEAGRVCQMKYEVRADQSFHTRSAQVAGTIGSREVLLSIRADRGGKWSANGSELPKLAGCIDLDLGFTPATNLLPIRRLALRIGQETKAQTAYLDVPLIKLRAIPQHYKRVSKHAYAYESPVHGYRATLQVSKHGAIERYPEVFEQEKAK